MFTIRRVLLWYVHGGGNVTPFPAKTTNMYDPVPARKSLWRTSATIQLYNDGRREERDAHSLLFLWEVINVRKESREDNVTWKTSSDCFLVIFIEHSISVWNSVQIDYMS